jgi:hypothetical protein
MAELKVEGGVDTNAAKAALTNNKKAAENVKTVCLTFSKSDELDVYDSLATAAEDKDYSLSKFIVRVLTGKETLNISE